MHCDQREVRVQQYSGVLAQPSSQMDDVWACVLRRRRGVSVRHGWQGVAVGHCVGGCGNKDMACCNEGTLRHLSRLSQLGDVQMVSRVLTSIDMKIKQSAAEREDRKQFEIKYADGSGPPGDSGAPPPPPSAA